MVAHRVHCAKRYKASVHSMPDELLMTRLRLVLFFLAFYLPAISWSESIDVTSGNRINADANLSWCATEVTASLDDVQQGGCTRQKVKPGDLARGMDKRAFWLHATLSNSSADTVERWIFVGHPRLEEVSLFKTENAKDWFRQDIGLRIPFSQRNDIGRAYGVIPVFLAPGSEQTIWLRVASRTAIDLSTTLWAPSEFRDVASRSQFSLTLALGGLFIVMILSCLAFATTREWSYLFFAVSMFGEILLEGVRTGLLQRFFLPPDLPLPVELAAIGSLLAVMGFTVFFHAFVPSMSRKGGLYRLFAIMVVVTVLTQLWSVFIDYREGALIWSFSVNGVILVGISLAIFAWREGVASAGTLVFSFAFLAVLELLRLGAVLGWLPFFWAETMAGPWALVMTTPLVLLSIFQRSRELHDKLMRAELENAAKVEFLAQMSHELRSPLDTILGNAQLLSRPSGKALAPDGLNLIKESGIHLLGMIDEILDHARGMAGKLKLEIQPVNWPEFLARLGHNAKLFARKNNNQFSLEYIGRDIRVLVLDEGRLRQVLDNLLSNAARHTANGTIRLVITTSDFKGNQARIHFSVMDSGDGIALVDQERIFLPFERGSNNVKQRGKGTGMGLAISRQLVESMGGNLVLESTPGQGACFKFCIDCEIGDEAPENSREFNYTDYDGQQRHILVVDDDANSRSILSNLLSFYGFRTCTASNGKDAIEMIRCTGGIDLILVDQFMENGDGWNVLNEVLEIAPKIPMVLMSSALPERPSWLDQKKDFSTFLLKPLDHPNLLRVVGELLELKWLNLKPDALVHSPKERTTFEIPDETVLEKLQQMIECGAMTDIMDWATDLKAGQPCYEDFADKVYSAAYRIDFPALQAMSDRAP